MANQDRLFYYSKSKDVFPGKGINEFVNHPEEYQKLSEYKDWRKVLSNFYTSPFQYNGKTWNSVEHIFQSVKIGLVEPEKAEWFTVESGNPIGLGDGLIARKNRKLVFLNPEQLKEWNKIKSQVMEDAMYAKFTQIPLVAKFLMATQEAELWHSPGREPKQRQYELENVRDKLWMDTDLRILKKLMK